MSERSIFVLPDPILRKQAKEVSRLTPATKSLVEDMIETMHVANGVGLAANQVGTLQKIFVYDDGEIEGVIVNPKIVSTRGEQIGQEGCLSVPGLQGEVRRAMEVEIRGLDLSGRPVKLKAEGLLARIFQHELDHLYGRLFVDKAEPDSLHYVTKDEEEEEEL
jgi:peptide deformylase